MGTMNNLVGAGEEHWGNFDAERPWPASAGTEAGDQPKAGKAARPNRAARADEMIE
jgi:hypothetical protein